MLPPGNRPLAPGVVHAGDIGQATNRPAHGRTDASAGCAINAV